MALDAVQTCGLAVAFATPEAELRAVSLFSAQVRAEREVIIAAVSKATESEASARSASYLETGRPGPGLRDA